MGEHSLKVMRAEHMKQKADKALKDENYRTAWTTYTEILKSDIPSSIALKVYSNRSLAFAKSKKFHDALADADRCCSSAPKWDKAHFRRASALLGLHRVEEALLEFRSAFQLSQGDAACIQAIQNCCAKLNVERIGSCIALLISELERTSQVQPAQIEIADEAVIKEAWYCFIKAEGDSQDGTHPGKYARYLIDWVKHGLPEYMAYWLRGSMNCMAKCYLQAREDARLGIESIVQLMKKKDAKEYLAVLEHDLADCYGVLGRAFKAEEEHEDQDTLRALVAFYRARDLNPNKQEFRNIIKAIEEKITLEDMREAARQAVCSASANVGGPGLRNPELLPECQEQPTIAGQNAMVNVNFMLTSAAMKLADFSADVRASLREALASAAGGMPAKQVVIEHVKAAKESGLEVQCTLACPSMDVATKFVDTCGASDSNQLLAQHLTSIDSRLAQALFGGTHGCTINATIIEADISKDPLYLGPSLSRDDNNRKAVIQPAKPKLELAVPYQNYSLVYSDGTPVPRKSKHAFAMTIVRYSSTLNEKEIWTQISDGSCRWRQSSSEIKIIALKAPQHVAPSEFDVTMSPYYIKVANKNTSEVYLEGKLERGIIPDESVWVAGQGTGEDGFMLFLQKMNLELLQKHGMHSEMWWPRLFTDHTETEWDDCEKDYSDLPPAIMEQHRASEAQQQIESQYEKQMKDTLQSLAELDKARIIAREEKLRMMRDGGTKAWIRPACNVQSQSTAT